ncbi:MAG: hypothetical protein AB1717_08055 [Pseudomonadota bacterium]
MAARRCVVHIGMPKTGSSTIQLNLSKRLDDEGYFYPNFNNANVINTGNHSGFLTTVFFESYYPYHYWKSLGIESADLSFFRESFSEALQAEFCVDGSRNVILSGEDLFHWGYMDSNVIHRFKEGLARFFDEFLVVAYVRPLRSYMQSAFQQLVKYHDQSSLDFGHVYPEYRKLKKWQDVFGVDNVMLIPFKPETFPENDMVLDFTSRIGVKEQRSDTKLVNESISLEAIAVLFAYHAHFRLKDRFPSAVYGKLIYKLVDVLSSFGAEKLSFSGGYVRRAISGHQEDYQWIVEQMGEEFAEDAGSLGLSGIDSSIDLLKISTLSIPHLRELAGDFSSSIPDGGGPQTVANLVDGIMSRLSS